MGAVIGLLFGALIAGCCWYALSYLYNRAFRDSSVKFKDLDGSVVQINGTTYTGSAGNIQIKKGVVYIDGKAIPEINIVINGDVNSINADACSTIKVTGNSGIISTMSGNVSVGEYSGPIKTMSGDVTVKGNINGSVSTMSGDVNI